MKKLLLSLSLLIAASVAFYGCVKKDFDNPPNTNGDDPNLPVNMTIKALRAMKPNTGSINDTMLITNDWTIAVIVNADDRSSNLYKLIYVQDSTAGIQLNINSYNLYNDYPVGRKIYIKLKGLYLSYSGATGTPCLSGAIDETGGAVGITGTDINDHIIKASIGNEVKDTVISFDKARVYNASLASALVCRLVTISDSVQFADTIRTYTDINKATNRYITTCGANLYVGNTTPNGTMAVRTDNYADFHATKLPYGKGTIRGIYTLFSTTPQLVLRDTTDVQFGGPRCGVLPPPPTATLITVDSLRKMYPGSGNFTIPAARVSGTVISDLSKGNSSAGNFIIEDGSRKGVILYISGGAYNLGDSLVIDVTGGKLSLYNGGLELSGVTAAKITKVTTGKTVVPTQITIAALNASFVQYESTLIKIVNATIAAGGSYSGNKSLSDGTGSISLYTAPGATFSAQAVPTTPKTYVVIPTVYTPNEVKLRDPANDVY